MRTPEDPCRDPASEARDDHASEPRATPETDALVPSQGRIRTMREYIDELEAHARRLERQRDKALDELRNLVPAILMRRDKGVMDMTAIDRLAELHESERQRDGLLDALLEIASREWIENALNPQDAASIAEKAIAAMKGGRDE